MNETIKLILILALITVIVSIFANIELFITKRRAFYDVPITKNFVMLKPEYTGLSKPVWIFNSKNIKSRNIPHSNGFNKNEYTKYRIEEHLASKLNRPLKEFFTTIKQIPKSKMPLNALFNTISKGEVFATSVDPGTINNRASDYKIIHSKNDNIETFIADDRIYLLNTNSN